MSLTMPRMGLGLALATVMVLVSANRIDHYEALPSNNLEEAVSNFSEYNHKLAAILTKGELDDEDLNHIHQLTYTLEVALEKIQFELGELADVLEELHVASETVQYDAALRYGQEYLTTARILID